MEELFTSITYVATPIGGAVLEGVQPSTASAAGGTQMRVLLSNFLMVDSPSDLRVEMMPGSIPVTVLSVVSSVFGTHVSFIAPPMSPGDATVLFAPVSKVENMVQFAITYVDFSIPKIVGVYPSQGHVTGGTTVTVRLQDYVEINSELDLQIISPSGRMVIESILQTDPTARAMTFQFTTLPASAGTVTMQISPLGRTDVIAAPSFDFVYTTTPMPSAAPTVVHHELDPVNPAEPLVHPNVLSVEGHEKVSVTVEGLGAADPSTIRVVIGETRCAVESVLRAGNVASVTIASPRAVAGRAALLVFAGRFGVPETTTLVASSQVTFVEPISHLTSAAALPAHGSNAGGEAVALVLENVPFGMQSSAFAVSLGGVACEITGLMYEDGVYTLHFKTPTVTTTGLVQGTVTMMSDSEWSVSSPFDFTLIASNQPRVVFAHPTSGSATGGASVRLSVASLQAVVDPADMLVRFGSAVAFVEEVISVADHLTELRITVPPFQCPSRKQECDVKVSVAPIGDELSAATFSFRYTMPHPIVASVVPATARTTGGSRHVVSIKNFPRIFSAAEVGVFMGATNLGHPDSVRFSGDLETVLEITAPPASHGAIGELTLTVAPLLELNQAVEVMLALESESDPVLLSYWPQSGPAGTVFTVNAIIHKYPIRPPGSFDASYANVAGPISPRVLAAFLVDGHMSANNTASVQIISAKIVEGGLKTSDSTTQVMFTMLAPAVGVARVDIAQDVLPVRSLVSFEVEIVDPRTPFVASVSPRVGPLDGGTVLVDIGNFSAATAASAIVVAGRDLCDVTHVATSEWITTLHIQLPPVRAGTTRTVTVLPHPSAATAVSFEYEYRPACDYASFCAAYGMKDASTRLTRLGETLECRYEFCIDPVHDPSPKVVHVDIRDGPRTGGTAVKLTVQDLAAGDKGDVVVFFGRELALIEAFELLANGLVEIAVRTPKMLEAGEVTGTVSSLVSSAKGAPFAFKYHSPAIGAPEILHVTPSECIEGEEVFSHVTLSNIDPKAPSAFSLSPQSTAPIEVVATWASTKLTFRHNCAGAAGDTATTTISVASGGQVAVQTAVVAREMSITSVFPTVSYLGAGVTVRAKVSGLSQPLAASFVAELIDGFCYDASADRRCLC